MIRLSAQPSPAQPIFHSCIHSLSQSTVQQSANDALFVKYMCMRFILRRKSALTNHSISVLSVYSFIFGLIEHNPYCRHVREDDTVDSAVVTDDGPYGQRFARIVSKNRIRAGVMYFINRAVRRWSATDTKIPVPVLAFIPETDIQYSYSGNARDMVCANKRRQSPNVLHATTSLARE